MSWSMTRFTNIVHLNLDHNGFGYSVFDLPLITGLSSSRSSKGIRVFFFSPKIKLKVGIPCFLI